MFVFKYLLLTRKRSAEVKIMMQCLSVLLQCLSQPLCVLQKLSLGILRSYFENEFLELAYVGKKLECLWRRALTALMA